MKDADRPDIFEDISAFMDDELPPEEGAAVVDRMLEDETLRRRWAHYHLIGDTLRGTDCRVQTALDDDDSLSARIAEEIEEIEEERSEEVEADASSPSCQSAGALSMSTPIECRRHSAHSHSSSPSNPSPSKPGPLNAPAASDPYPSSSTTPPSKPSRVRLFSGPVLAASIAVVAILGVEVIPSSEKKARHEQASSASMDPPSATQSEAGYAEEVIASTDPAPSDHALVSRPVAQDSSYRNLYLLRRAGYQGGELRAMQGYSRIVGDQALTH